MGADNSVVVSGSENDKEMSEDVLSNAISISKESVVPENENSKSSKDSSILFELTERWPTLSWAMAMMTFCVEETERFVAENSPLLSAVVEVNSVNSDSVVSVT